MIGVATLSRYRTSAILGSCWVGSAAVLAGLPDATVDRLFLQASTTLPRLAAWPMTLPVSGLLVRGNPAVWVGALLLGTVQLERQVGWRRTLVLLAGVHLGATALSQGLLGAEVALGYLPRSMLDQVDVGPSYLAVAGLAAAIVVAPTPVRRLLSGFALLVGVPALLAGLGQADLAATGHLAAAVLGAAGAWRLRLS